MTQRAYTPTARHNKHNVGEDGWMDGWILRYLTTLYRLQ